MLQPVPAAFVQILVVVVVPTQNGAAPLPRVGPVKLPACLHIPLASGLVHRFLPRWEMAKSESKTVETLQLLDGPEGQGGRRLNPKGLGAPKIWRR